MAPSATTQVLQHTLALKGERKPEDGIEKATTAEQTPLERTSIALNPDVPDLWRRAASHTDTHGGDIPLLLSQRVYRGPIRTYIGARSTASESNVDESSGPALWHVDGGDMICLDIETGRVVGGNTSRPANAAGYLIHSAVHKRRPDDVHAVCHAHSNAGRAWSVFARPLEMLNQDVCNFHNAHAVYARYGGIVFGAEEGEHIAEALGATNKGVILMNHGLLTVGSTVDEAGFMFGLMDRACEMQLQVEAAAANGLTKRIISDEEAAYNFKWASERNALYREAQPDIEFEFEMAGGEDMVARGFENLQPLEL
ncbi:hypothetical protein E0Z10_g5927 [Xylaria hypoxylon]|uniref:Class II aldolase/adducin N-terminal domain-containing protein n=1 Tax=Xylaria hypoxylon TaxID=37992 RepID=A0A4Z0YS38_9PEZI|nr:hypothetical protein E0Z10_g5927 [Xylaria hypoxylon]